MRFVILSNIQQTTDTLLVIASNLPKHLIIGY